jgi:hypothetical protein
MTYQFRDQPIVVDEEGVKRFVANPIVAYLFDVWPNSMNGLAMLNFPADVQAHFAQLIGYSVSSYGDLPYVSDALFDRAASHNAAQEQPGYAAGFDAGFAAGMARAIEVLEEYRKSEAV